MRARAQLGNAQTQSSGRLRAKRGDSVVKAKASLACLLGAVNVKLQLNSDGQ